MQAKRSYEALPGLKETVHKLSVTIGGDSYTVEHIDTYEVYYALDPNDAANIIDSYLWGKLMHTIEHNLRKNLIHDYSHS